MNSKAVARTDAESHAAPGDCGNSPRTEEPGSGMPMSVYREADLGATFIPRLFNFRKSVLGSMPNSRAAAARLPL